MLDKSRLHEDFVYFTEECLGFRLSDFHKKVIPIITKPIKNRFICILWPRGHLKTTIFSKAYPIWKLYREENFEICRFASSIPQSRRTLIEVRRIIETNKYLKHLVQKEEKWNQSELYTLNGNQYYITPFTDSARGSHVDLLIGDDILRDTDISPEKIKDMFWNVCYPMVQTKKGQVILVGTPMSPNDLLVEIKKKEDWLWIKESAVITDKGGEWIKPLWPENFTLDELHKIRENMGGHRFSQEFMCSPETIGTRPFPSELILECCDDNLKFSLLTEGAVFIGCDLAASAGKYGDYSVYIVADMVKGNYEKKTKTKDGIKRENIKDPIIIRKMIRFKGVKPAIQKERIKLLVDDYKPINTLIDSSQWGSSLIDELRSEHITVKGEDFKSANRRDMISNLRRLFESKRIIIPTSQDDYTYNTTKFLIEELSKIIITETPAKNITYQVASGHDDCVMALALAVKNAFTQRPSLSKSIYTPETKSLNTMQI